MPAISIIARTRRKDDHGRVPLRMRISHRGEKRFISLPVKVLAKKWNGEKRRVTGIHPDAGKSTPFCWTWSPRPSQACLGSSGSGTAHCGPADQR